jgi:hypothetical protein
VDPNKFRIGDIVEVQLSFMAIPVKEGRYRLMLVMRALTLLDCMQSKVLDSIILVIHKFRLLITHITGSPSSQVEITK